MNHIAQSTGFTVMQNSLNFYSEATNRMLPDPSEDYGRGGFSHADRRDDRVRRLVRKASAAYTVDAMVRQSVDKFSELFKDFTFNGGEKQVKYLHQRMISMTLQTGEHWQTLFTRIIHEYFKTGNSFIVKRRGGGQFTGTRALYRNKPYTISGLTLISSDRLEIARDSVGGFTGWEIRGTKNDVDLNLVLPSATKLNPDSTLIQISRMPDRKNVLVPGMDIVQIAYKRGADSHWGFGLTLAALEDISLTRTLEQTTAIMMKKFSNPIIHHKILRPSSPLAGMQQEINMAYDLYRRSAPDGVIITGGNAEIKAVGSESQALRVGEYLKYFMGRSLAGLGMSPFIMGLEAGGQGTLESAVELMMMKVRFCQAEIARELEMFIINEILWEGGFDPYNKEEDKVTIKFEDLDENRVIKMQNHAADLFTKNLADHPEARTLAGLPAKSNEKELHFNKVEIPKSKAEAQHKGEAQKTAGVAIAKARPRPKPAKKKSKEVAADIKNIIPETPSQILTFINLMEKRFGYDPDLLVSLFDQIELLLGDSEAITEFLIERLSNG